MDQASSALANLTQEEGKLLTVHIITKSMPTVTGFSGEALMKVSPEELKAVMDSLTTETLSTYQVCI